MVNILANNFLFGKNNEQSFAVEQIVEQILNLLTHIKQDKFTE